jgi:hypothetical protein
MARNCNCAGSTCGCLVVGGAGIEVTGQGTSANPFQITNIASDLASSFTISDTTTLDLILTGGGTNADPFILQGNVIAKLQQLGDVNNPGGNPVAGQRPVYVGTSGADGHWEFQYSWPQYTTAARPAVATAPTGFTYFDTTLGKPVWRKNSTTYVDATGATV